jgi:superfamily II DNA or RNA helicase
MPASPRRQSGSVAPPQCSSRLDERTYQQYILRRIRENRNRNLLIELDCGLGKRVLTYKLVTELFPDTKFILSVNSTSSLQETAEYLTKKYGGVSGLGVLSPAVQGPRRQRILKEARVVICTARVLANVLQRGAFSPEDFDALVINEVDTILRRIGLDNILIQPWRQLLDFFKGRWIIGLSGTLRDDHVVMDEAQLQIREELKTLRQFIPNAELISMDELAGTDVQQYINPTTIDVVPVHHPAIHALSLVLDDLIQSTREEIYASVQEESEKDARALPRSARLLHLLLAQLPIPEELGQRYSTLLMLRKYLYGMSARSFRRFLHHPVLASQIDIERIMKDWPLTTPKTLQVRDLAMHHGKTVAISSYLPVVAEIDGLLSKAKVQTFILTGRVPDKEPVIAQFKAAKPPAALVLSPVGERDLDIPDADLLIICDVVNTTKTIYQKMKRTRGGRVVFLTYADTSEIAKVRRLIDKIMQKYPWSTRLGDTSALKTD